MADQPRSVRSRSTCSSSEVRRSRVGGGLGLPRTARRARPARAPGPHPRAGGGGSCGYSIAAGAVVEDAVPDRVEEQVVPSFSATRGSAGSTSSATRAPDLRRWAAGRPGSARRCLPSRPGPSRPGRWRTRRPAGGHPGGRQPGPRPGREPPQARRTIPSGGTRRRRQTAADRDKRPRKSSCDNGNSQPRELVRVAGELRQGLPDGSQGRRAPPAERSRIGGP